MATEIGKRFECEDCGCETLCIRGGDGDVSCCGAPMTQKQAKILPSSD